MKGCIFMRKKENVFHFHYKDDSREIELITSSKDTGKACKLLKKVVPTACLSRKRKVVEAIPFIASLLNIIDLIARFFSKIIGLFMHIYFQEKTWISKYPNYSVFQI